MDKKTILLSLTVILALLQYSCASYEQRASQELMQEATSYNSQGDTYSAVKAALKALETNNQNEEAKRFVQANYNRALEKAISTLNGIPKGMDELPRFRKELQALGNMQSTLKNYNFTQADIFDVNTAKNNYETSLSQNVIKEIDVLLRKGDADKARALIDQYKSVGLPVNEQFIAVINTLASMYLSQNRYIDLIDYASRNRDFLKGEPFKEIYQGLLDYANNDAITNKRRALDTYALLLELDKNNDVVRNKILVLKNELLIMVAILDIENQTDEFIPTNNKESIDYIKSKLDDKEKLIEVIVKDDGINELKDRSINYDYIRNNKELNIKFENNIHFLVIPKIANLRINRQTPSMVTKNASWKFNSYNDAIATGLAEYQAYGSYKVQYYQYDEYTENVAGRIVLDFILYDVLQKRIVLKDRIEVQEQDSVTWAENPMAVGIVNKIPARVYPMEIQDLMNRKRSTMTDNEIKKKLISKISDEVVSRVKPALLTQVVQK